MTTKIPSGAPVARESEPVQFDAGIARGVVEGDVTVFRGIPYAAPPVGMLRWRAPQPAIPWTGVRLADTFGNDCLQPETHAPLPPPAPVIPPPRVGMSEDCLTLNVWAPPKSSSVKHPVMVWFHGGGFYLGAGSWESYNGTQLARDGVVLVTVNYRLGAFGFFAHPGLSEENPVGPVTNFGVLDTIAALAWVKRNIAAIGGDPENVTIFGESAGGMLVDVLMVSPLSKGLFHRAIAQSGPALPTQPLRATGASTTASAEDWGRSFTIKAGLDPDDLAGLRALPAEKIAALSGGFGGNTGVVVDGDVLPMAVGEAFAGGIQHKVPFMVGSTDFEGGLLSAMVLEPKLDPAQQERYANAYNPDGRREKALIWQLAAGDCLMGAPARRLAREMQTVGAPAYLFEFAYVPESVRSRTPGAWHGAEIPYIFGTLHERSPDHGAATAIDLETSRVMREYWVTFAKTGNPNHAGALNWPAYEATQDQTMVFSNQGPMVVKAHLKERLDFQDELIK